MALGFEAVYSHETVFFTVAVLNTLLGGGGSFSAGGIGNGVCI